LIVPDTPAKRREYEEEVVRTFYLSNADLKETMDLLRMVLDARRISPTTATNALTVKDSPERVAAAARVISAIDKARPEVIIDVELMEVDRTKLQDYGLQIASPGSPGLNGSVTVAGRPSTSDRWLSVVRRSEAISRCGSGPVREPPRPGCWRSRTSRRCARRTASSSSPSPAEPPRRSPAELPAADHMVTTILPRLRPSLTSRSAEATSASG